MLPQQGESEEKLRQVSFGMSVIHHSTVIITSVFNKMAVASETAAHFLVVLHCSTILWCLSVLQRQRLRQLILRQQQQKNVSRQEKVLQDGASGPPHHWLQKESTSASPANPFGRPPPPYPGSVRPSGTMALRCPGNFTAVQPRNPSEAASLRQNLPGEQGGQGLVQR